LGTLPRHLGGTGQRAATAFGDTRSSVTYLLVDPETGTALTIDPGMETVRCELQRLGRLRLELRNVPETHVRVEQLGGPAGLIRRPLLTAKQSPLPRSRVRLRKIRVGWNKVPSRVFILVCGYGRHAYAAKQPSSRTGEHLQEEPDCAIGLKLLPSAALPQAAAVQVSPWIKAVADYQQLYTRATLANVSEDPALSTRVISDLRIHDGIAVLVPGLRSAELTFKRVQRLSFHDRPVVQMVYLPSMASRLHSA
jgi:hypothetical protein